VEMVSGHACHRNLSFFARQVKLDRQERAHLHTAPDSGRAKLRLCLDSSASERRGIRTGQTKTSLRSFLRQFGRRGSNALP
jgi:hypothetical protein